MDKIKKNIYIFDEYLSSKKNGIGSYIKELIHCFILLKHNVCLIVFNTETEEFKIIKENNIKKILFPFLRGYFTYYVGIIDKLLRLNIEDNSDNIFFINHTPCDELIESLKKHFPLSKVVFTIHDFWWTMSLMGNLNEYKIIIKNSELQKDCQIAVDIDSILKMYKKEKKMYDLADYIICLSKDTSLILQNIYKIKNNKLFLIPNGLHDVNKNHISLNNQIEKNRELLYLKKEDKILLFIGRPTKQKGIFDLLEAMHIILKHCPNTKLVIIGDDNEVSIKELINKISPLASAVILTGHINKITLYKWLSIANVGVISSYYEQCTYTGIEMMMFGLPLVVSDGIGLKNMFIDNRNAKIVRIGNRKQAKKYQNKLANAIIELLQSPELCRTLSYGARKTYELNYTNKKMRDNYNLFLEQLT